MRFTILIFVILVFCFEQILSQDRLSWKEYKIKNYIKYITMAEHKYRKRMYLRNLAKIEEHNDKFKKGLVSYKMKMNKFGHLTEKEFIEKYTSGLSSNANPNKPKYKLYHPANTSAPARLDWRRKNAVGPVQDQKSCSSSYAFAALTKIEVLYYIKYKKSIQLSVQQVIDCGKNHILHGCKGGYFEGVLDYAIDFGLTTKNAYPYEAVDGPCRLGKHRILARLKQYERVTPGSTLDMQLAIAVEGPVVVLVNGNVLRFLDTDKTLTGNWCINNTDKNHAVVVVGYDSTPKGEKYWIVQNSWGKDWGNQGYFHVEFEPNDVCGFTDHVLISYLS